MSLHKGRRTRWLGRLRHTMALLLLTPLCVAAMPDVKVSDEARLKLAYLYNIAQFVDWPATPGTPDDALRLCIVGEDPFGDDLRALAGRAVRGRSIQVLRPTRLDDIKPCHMVYMERLGGPQVPPKLLEQLRSEPMLILSGERGAVQRGAAIEFVTLNARLRWYLNTEATRRAGLRVSAKLLEVSLPPPTATE